MVLNAAVQMLREADELKERISKFKSGTSMLQERSLWATQQQLQKVYQKVLVLDLDYALDKKVEQDLWNVGFKQQIEALQAISKDRKNPLRSEGQAMLSWVLQAAAGFYLCLLHQICTTLKLDLPFRRRASLLGLVEGWGAGECAVGARVPPPAAARYICQHCLVHLGDLARYRQQLRVAHTFYRHALVVSAMSGQPYNQLALVAWRRGRRLGALYWHVRSLLVRAPFPPARANLARTLRAAAADTNDVKDLPVLPGVTGPTETSTASVPGRLDAHSYVTELIRAIHYIHNLEELETASALVNTLNSSLSALIATESFESMTLIKMACVLIWLVHSTNEDLSIESSALTESEAFAAQLACSLAANALLALLLPNYTVASPLQRSLPAINVWLQWVLCSPRVAREASWHALVALWPALAHTCNMLAPAAALLTDTYDTVPLPEDEELTGFLPLENAHKGLNFPNHAAWDTYGGQVPETDEHQDDDNDIATVSPACLSSSLELQQRVRARRVLLLAKRLAELCPENLTYTETEGEVKVSASSVGGEQLTQALAALAEAGGGSGGGSGSGAPEPEDESDDEPSAPPPPIVISEADFREKVREKRVGILKPQGSLERAREERAMATQEEQDLDACEDWKNEDKRESRKPRVNIAMAAIMRKQEETNKQVKFVTPPPTPDSTGDTTEAKDDKPKIIQPKVMKSLANLPIGRKTGGILSLKDKSAGYPHLVNTEEPKKPEKEDKKDKPPQPSSQNSQSYIQKRPEETSPNWPAMQQYTDAQRLNFQKNYGIQNAGISYNPSYQPVNNTAIKLPVVNPKEIDVRTAALQKQNSRQDLFQDGAKFNQGYQMSGDKKNFLNDLPPRFANQYRYWQNQDNQIENKFRDDSFNTNTFNQSRAWNAPPPQQLQQNAEGYQPMWWKPEQPSFNANYTQPIQSSFYNPHLNTNIPNPYQNMPYNVQNTGQSKENFNQPYLQTAIGQPQIQTLQNLVTSPNFNSTLNSFNTYAPSVSYDSSMYPQFNNKLGYQPLQMKMLDKPQLNYQGNKDLDMGGLGFASNVLDMQQRNASINFNEPINELGGMKSLDSVGNVSSAGAGLGASNTYSLFSGDSGWPHGQRPPAQSLWSGPGPSPLERLLEQQKQMKPPAPQ